MGRCGLASLAMQISCGSGHTEKQSVIATECPGCVWLVMKLCPWHARPNSDNDRSVTALVLGMLPQEMILYLQKLPTGHWSEKEVESVLSRAYMWRASFDQAKSHLSHQ